MLHLNFLYYLTKLELCNYLNYFLVTVVLYSRKNISETILLISHEQISIIKENLLIKCPI